MANENQSRNQKTTTLDMLYSKPTGDRYVDIYNTYLKRTLGRFLPDILHRVSQTNPEDPIQFIAVNLYRKMDCDNYYRQKARYFKELLKAKSDIVDANKADAFDVRAELRLAKRQLREARQHERDVLYSLLTERLKDKASGDFDDFWEETGDWTEEDIRKRIGYLDKKLHPMKPRKYFDVHDFQCRRLELHRELALSRAQIRMPDISRLTKSDRSKLRRSVDEVVDGTRARVPSIDEEMVLRERLERELTEALEKGNYELTDDGAIVLASPSFEHIGLEMHHKKKKKKRTTALDQWYRDRQRCTVMYEDDLYTRCDFDNFDSVPADVPAMTCAELLGEEPGEEPEPLPEPEVWRETERNRGTMFPPQKVSKQGRQRGSSKSHQRGSIQGQKRGSNLDHQRGSMQGQKETDRKGRKSKKSSKNTSLISETQITEELDIVE